MMPFLISSLGEKWYGLWLLIGTIMSFFGLLSIGLMSAVQRYLSTEKSEEKNLEYNRTVNTALLIFSIAGALSITLSLIVSLLSSYFVTDEELLSTFEIIVFMLGINFALSFICAPFKALLNTDYHFNITSLADFLSLSIKAGLTILFIYQGLGVISLAIATIVSSIISKLVVIINVLIKIKKLKFGKQYINKAKAIQLFKFSFSTFIAWIGDILRFSIDNLVISAFIGLSAVTIYNIPIRLFNYASQFIITSLSVLQPYFSQRVGENNKGDIREKFELASGVSFGLGALFASGLFVFGYDFISLWVNDYPELKQMMYVVPWLILLATSQNPSVMVLYAYNKHKHYAHQNIAEGLANAAISLIAVQYWGMMGVLLGSLLPMLITKLILQPKLTCGLIDFSRKKYYKIMLSSYLYSIIISVLAINIKADITSWLELSYNVAIFFVIFVFGFYFFALNKKAKAFLDNKLKNTIKHKKASNNI